MSKKKSKKARSNRPELSRVRFTNDRLNGGSGSDGWMKGNYLGVGYRVTVYYRTLVWLGSITGTAPGNRWLFDVTPTAFLGFSVPRSDMITVTVTNPGGQTSDPLPPDPQPVIVP